MNCKECGTEFEDKTSNHIGRYCSKRCQRKVGDRLRKPKKCVCQYCGEIYWTLRRKPKSPQQYCSIRCAKIKGESRVTHDGYRAMYLRTTKVKSEFRGSNTWPYVYEHIAIAEKALGRRLKKGEVVHHINGNTLDNRNCNLLICTQTYHNELHHRMSRLYQKEHFGNILYD